MTATAHKRDTLSEASAADLLEHAGYSDMIRDVVKEARAARAILLGSDDRGEVPQAHARGSLAVLRNIVLGVYTRANKEIPPNIAALFE